MTGKIFSRYLTLALNVSYYWVQYKWLHFYSGLGIGLTHVQHETYGIISASPNRFSGVGLQFNLLGAKIAKKLSLMTEIGAGYRGVFTIGLAYHL